MSSPGRLASADDTITGLTSPMFIISQTQYKSQQELVHLLMSEVVWYLAVGHFTILRYSFTIYMEGVKLILGLRLPFSVANFTNSGLYKQWFNTNSGLY